MRLRNKRSATGRSRDYRSPSSAGTSLSSLKAAIAAGRLIPPARLAEMLEPTILKDGVAVDYGLGTRLGRLGGHRVWGHTGSVLLSYNSTLASYPDDDIAIAVLVNTTNASTDALVVEGLLSWEVLSLRDPASGQVPSPTASIYSGDYVGGPHYDAGAILDGIIPDARESFRIVEEDGQLERIVLTGDPRPPLELIYKGKHTFGRPDWPMDTFVFHVADGRARGYSEYYNGIFATFNRRVKP